MTFLNPRSVPGNVDGVAPHPIPSGKENMGCPFFFGRHNTDDSKAELDADPDIQQERLSHLKIRKSAKLSPPVGDMQQFASVPLNLIGRTHHFNVATTQLVRSVGIVKLEEFTTLFYQRQFADSHVDQFIRSHAEAHHKRFAAWIMEKFGDGTPWTDERRTRPATHLRIGHQVTQVSYDRSSSHFAAWHSPKRAPDKFGQHFKPEDARIWMRLHFWAAREVGMFDLHPEFMNYYVKFIGHFIRVYSSSAPPFTRESVRWSASPANLEEYVASGNRMSDVIGKPVDAALLELPSRERLSNWPVGDV